MFDYRLERKLKEEQKKVYPTLITCIDENWENQTGVTMEELFPTMQSMLLQMYQMHHFIQRRYVLTPYSRKDARKIGKSHHFQVEYYGVPIDELIDIPDSIIIDWQKCKMKIDANGNIDFENMSYNERWFNQAMEWKFLDKNARNRIIWLGTEESDINVSEFSSIDALKNKRVPLERRNLNQILPLEDFIIAYIEARENGELIEGKVAVKK